VNGEIALARAYAVDQLLLAALSMSPLPPHNEVILIDDPAEDCVRLRYWANFAVYVVTCRRVMFEVADDGTLRVSPCAPRPEPEPREPGVVYSHTVTRYQLDWRIADPLRSGLPLEDLLRRAEADQ
jgi:hypothetical protein